MRMTGETEADAPGSTLSGAAAASSEIPPSICTQELLAEVLGVQRTTVTTAARALQRAGLIAYKWGSVTVLDRAGLERVSCECYGVIREHYEQVFSCIRG